MKQTQKFEPDPGHNTGHQQFDFNPSEWVPFKDKKEINRVLAIKREDIEKHKNPDFKIQSRPQRSIPDMFYVNKYMKLIESELF